MKITLGCFVFAAASVAACAADGTLPARPPVARDVGVAPPTRIPKLEKLPELGTPMVMADVPQSVRRAVVADAARRFNVAESAVVLAHAEQVTWPDGSLGCPEPGLYYTQNLVPGYVIVAKTPGGELVFHTDTRDQARSCRKWRAKTNGEAPQPTDR